MRALVLTSRVAFDTISSFEATTDEPQATDGG